MVIFHYLKACLFLFITFKFNTCLVKKTSHDVIFHQNLKFLYEINVCLS